MKRLNVFTVSLILTIIAIGLTSCQFNSEVQTIIDQPSTPLQLRPTPGDSDGIISPKFREELSDSDRWIHMLRLDDKWKYGSTTLAPNGVWIASNASQEPRETEFLDLTSTEDENLQLKFQPEPTLGIMEPGAPIWSPNSANLAYWGIDTLQPECFKSRLIIVSIDSDEILTPPGVFDLPGESPDCATFTWSPDSTMLAVSSTKNHEGEIVIIDTHGQTLQSIPIALKEFSSFSQYLVWLPSGIYYSLFVDLNQGYWTLHSLDLDSLDSTEIFHLGNWRVFGNDPMGLSQLIVTQRLFQFNDPTLPYKQIDEYGVLDLESKEIQKFEWESPTCQVFSSTDVFTAFACDNPHELWIYNWETESLNSYGEYGKLIGWSEKYQGYLLFIEHGDESPHMEILQP